LPPVTNKPLLFFFFFQIQKSEQHAMVRGMPSLGFAQPTWGSGGRRRGHSPVEGLNRASVQGPGQCCPVCMHPPDLKVPCLVTVFTVWDIFISILNTSAEQTPQNYWTQSIINVLLGPRVSISCRVVFTFFCTFK
jgi:hypothetical protein